MGKEQNLSYLGQISDLHQLFPQEFNPQNIVDIGVDVCDVPRLQKDIEEIGPFIPDNFTDEEIVYCEQARRPFLRAQRYAARLAAKEAVIKALGGIDRDGFSFKDITVLKGTISGRPFIFLDGKAKARAEEIGVNKILISVTHLKDHAIAWCIAIK